MVYQSFRNNFKRHNFSLGYNVYVFVNFQFLDVLKSRSNTKLFLSIFNCYSYSHYTIKSCYVLLNITVKLRICVKCVVLTVLILCMVSCCLGYTQQSAQAIDLRSVAIFRPYTLNIKKCKLVQET